MSFIKIECIDEPLGASVKYEQGLHEDNLHSETSKRRLKAALDYTLRRLAEQDLISSESSPVINEEHVVLANKIHEKIMEVLSEYTFVCEEELILSDEVDERGEYKEVEKSVSLSDKDYVPDEERSTDHDLIPLEYKRRVVDLVKAHPRWSLKTLQRAGAARLKDLKLLKRWEEQVKNGGTRVDKCNIIDKWAYDRFVEARSANQTVATKDLQQWALDAASQFPDLEFKASNTWVTKFKQKHKIRQRKITKIVSNKQTTTTTLSFPAIKQDADTS